MAAKNKPAPVAGKSGEKIPAPEHDASPEALLERIRALEAKVNKPGK